MGHLRGDLALIVLFMIALVGTFAGSLLRVITAAIIHETFGSLMLTGLLVTAFMVGRAVSSFVFASLSDRIRAYNVLALLGFALASLTAVLHMLLPVWAYHALRALFGVACGAAWPIAQRLVLEHARPEKRHRAMSIYFGMGMIGVTASYAVFPLVREDVALVLSAILFLATACGVMIVFPEKRGVTRRETRASARPPSVRSLALASIAFGGLVGVLSQDFLVGLALMKFHTRVSAGLALTLGSVIGIVLSYAVGWVIDRTGSRLVAKVLALISPLFVGALVLSPTPEVFVLSVGATRSALAALRPQILAMAKASRGTGLRVGVVNSLTNVSTACVPPLLGALLPSLGPLCALLLSLIHI